MEGGVGITVPQSNSRPRKILRPEDFESASAPATASQQFAKPSAADRPGLATSWGENKKSPITTMRFERRPGLLTTSTIYYNDKEGANALREELGSSWRGFSTGGCYNNSTRVRVGLETPRGHSLKYLWAAGKNIYIGKKGDPYVIALKNESTQRIEAVVSVDGLDVIDGSSASTSKRGYVLLPDQELKIRGFRRSLDDVAQFEFSSVSGSYANQRHGVSAARNVGVIGIAIHREKNEDINLRRDAEAFPNGFAKPPHG